MCAIKSNQIKYIAIRMTHPASNYAILNTFKEMFETFKSGHLCDIDTGFS